MASNLFLTGNMMGGIGGIVLYFVVIFGFFYLIVIRPQKKQQKQHADMLSTLAIGDSILTTAGFYGVVIDVMDEVVIVEFGSNKNCRIPMKRDAIVEIEKAEGSSEE
ncbi:preprotein translocase subunit YajC [Lachnospiraceae bacterium KM106-2]|nr:preprotein translocase subunit YajC [Lachnospiraceae bacterium KM106-2]